MGPPEPPSETRLLFVDESIKSEEIPFLTLIWYECPEDYFFDSDVTQNNMSIQCLSNGSFALPDVWKKCVHPSSKILLMSKVLIKVNGIQ